jgi:hypothetical protein
MSLAGQWIARYQGTNQGVLVVDIDKVDGHFEGAASAWDDNPDLPSSAVTFSTNSLDRAHRLQNLSIAPLDTRSGKMSLAQNPQVMVPKSLDVEFILTPTDRLSIKWVTNIGTAGTALALRSKAATDSPIQPRKVDDWKSFKEFISGIENNRFIFRGQKNSKWRLRTGFHRSGRANLNRFEVSDIRQLHRHLSGLTRHIFNLKDPMQNLAFINLVQHHGYPTPLLDWTHSPYVAAFFAFRDLTPEESSSQDGRVRIFKLDAPELYKLTGNLNALYPSRPSLTIVDAMPFENPRALPQQSISTVSTVDDIESHILDLDGGLLQVIDLPANARKIIFAELALMGITAGSMFPGIDGACEALRERNFF